jgi:hypothetical protein
MAEHAPKFEQRAESAKKIETLAKEVSNELRYTNGNFIKACDNVFDRRGISYNSEVRKMLKSDVGKILGEHSASLKTKKPKLKVAPETAKPREPEQIMRDANISRIKKIQAKNSLFSEEIGEKEGLSKLQEK